MSAARQEILQACIRKKTLFVNHSTNPEPGEYVACVEGGGWEEGKHGQVNGRGKEWGHIFQNKSTTAEPVETEIIIG